MHQNDELEKEEKLEEIRLMVVDWGMKNWHHGVVRGLLLGIPLGAGLGLLLRRLLT